MKVSRGKVHEYLGMTLDFTTKNLVKISMIKYVKELIAAWDKAPKLNDGFVTVTSKRTKKCAAPEDLFKIDEDATKLDTEFSTAFHNIIAKALYLLSLCRELATDPKKLRKEKSVKMIDDGVWSWFGNVLTFLPDRRCFIRISRIDRIPILDMCSEYYSLGCRDATVVTMMVGGGVPCVMCVTDSHPSPWPCGREIVPLNAAGSPRRGVVACTYVLSYLTQQGEEASRAASFSR